MANLPNIVPNNNPDSHWASRVNSNIRQNEAVSSPDFYIRRTAAGTTLTLKHKHKIQPPAYANVTEFSPDAPYDIGQEVNVSSGSYTTAAGTTVSASLGHWRCVVPIPSTYYSASLAAASAASGIFLTPDVVSFYTRTNGVNYAPVYPVPAQTASPTNPNGAYWHLVSSTGSASTSTVQRFTLVGVQGDYLQCKTYDGSTTGSSVIPVAKPPALRHVSATVIDGATWNFRYGPITNNLDGYRNAYQGANQNMEYHEVIPVWQIGGDIWAIQPQGGTGVSSGSVAVTWLDLNVDARAYCQYS